MLSWDKVNVFSDKKRKSKNAQVGKFKRFFASIYKKKPSKILIFIESHLITLCKQVIGSIRFYFYKAK